ncbi:transmembrane channel-like protein 3 isoform X2 [Lineus longissimus]|uniref:transmembrane channel-like protein 3 isoform X2 n=1 Tax=Lineus longissimus TaxID=88925 RepID=UPI00315DBAB8
MGRKKKLQAEQRPLLPVEDRQGHPGYNESSRLLPVPQESFSEVARESFSEAHRDIRRRRSTVPGLTDVEYAKRTRYCQFYSGNDIDEEDAGNLMSENVVKVAIFESIQYHIEVLESFREQPWPMKKKLRAARQAREFLRWQIKQVGGMKQLDSNQRMRMKKVSKEVDNSLKKLTIWGGPIEKIEGYFGSSVASYFLFLRTLLWINFVMGVLAVCFISVPQIIVGEDTKINITDGLDIVQDTIIFYGVYDYHEYLGIGYMLPMAYFITTLAIYLFCIITIVRRMTVKYRKTKRSADSEEYPFTWRCFVSWDFTITSKEGVRDKIHAMKTDFKELVRELKVRGKLVTLNRGFIYSVRVLINIITLAILGGTGYLIYFFVERQDTPLELGIPKFAEDLLQKYQLSLVMACLKLVVPVLFSLLVKLEKWHPRVELKWLLARTTLFYYGNLVILSISLYNVSTQCESGEMPAHMSCCYETVVGEEVAKVFLLDLGAMFVSVLVLDVLRAVTVKSSKTLKEKIGFSEFDISASVLEVIYGQGLIWLGLYFSPLLPVVAMAKVIIVFYLRYIVARTCNIPPKKMFRASRSGNFYLTLLLVTLFLCLVPVGYAIIAISPSPDCGPFRERDHVYQVITSRIGNLPSWLSWIINFILSPVVVIPVFIVLLLIIIYYRARASSYQDLIADLRTQLHFERSVGKRKILAAAQNSKFAKFGESGSETDISVV